MSDAPAVAEAAPEAALPPAPEPSPLTRRELFILHGGLVLTNVIWSIMHVVMAVPLRRGANAAVLSVYRETIGAVALSSAAYALERRVARCFCGCTSDLRTAQGCASSAVDARQAAAAPACDCWLYIRRHTAVDPGRAGQRRA